MGFLKGCLKVVGTVGLGAAGAASKVLEEISSAAGIELGEELFGTVKEASKNGIRSMWDDGSETSDKVFEAIDKGDDSTRGTGRKMMANTAKKAAEVARRNGDMEKYEHYMQQYEMYKD